MRFRSRRGIAVDLLFASSGIEAEIVQRAEIFVLPDMGAIAVARAEELLAIKILSMAPKRLQDRIDAQNFIPTSTARPCGTTCGSSRRAGITAIATSQRCSTRCWPKFASDGDRTGAR